MSKSVGFSGVKGFAAWMGSWVAMCSIADYVLVIESTAWAMAYGVLAYAVANAAQNWIEDKT